MHLNSLVIKLSVTMHLNGLVVKLPVAMHLNGLVTKLPVTMRIKIVNVVANIVFPMTTYLHCAKIIIADISRCAL